MPDSRRAFPLIVTALFALIVLAAALDGGLASGALSRSPAAAFRFPTALSRLPVGLAISLPCAIAALALRQVTRGGAVAGLAIATALWCTAGWQAWLQLGATLLVAALATRAGRSRNASAGLLDDGAGRGWRNIVANTGIAAAAAVVMSDRHPAIAPLVIAAALATGSSDTAASEIGKAWGGAPVDLVRRRRVAPGSPGAVSTIGIAASVAAAIASALVAGTTGLLDGWNAAMVAIAAPVAAGLESYVSAIAESRGWLDSDGVNLVATILGAALAVILRSVFA